MKNLDLLNIMTHSKPERKKKEKKISIFTKKGLEGHFPGAKAVRTKSGWNIVYPLPKDYANESFQDWRTDEGHE